MADSLLSAHNSPVTDPTRRRRRLAGGQESSRAVLQNRVVDKKPVGPPPSTAKGDIAESLARAALSAVPVVGGPAAELLGLVVDPALHRRYRHWLEYLAAAVDDLQEHGVDVRTLEGNEPLITVILNATAAAARTHEEEKLEALRNAITNAALGLEPDEHMQIMFVKFIDEFTALHLRILAFFRDPAAWFESHGIPRPSYYMGGRGQVLEDGVPELRNRKDIYMQAASELGTRGLLAAALSGMVSEQGMWQSITMPLGNRFLDFISKPK